MDFDFPEKDEQERILRNYLTFVDYERFENEYSGSFFRRVLPVIIHSIPLTAKIDFFSEDTCIKLR